MNVYIYSVNHGDAGANQASVPAISMYGDRAGIKNPHTLRLEC